MVGTRSTSPSPLSNRRLGSPLPAPGACSRPTAAASSARYAAEEVRRRRRDFVEPRPVGIEHGDVVATVEREEALRAREVVVEPDTTAVADLLVERAVHDQERRGEAPVVFAAGERAVGPGERDRGVDALVDAARVEGGADRGDGAIGVPACADALTVDEAGGGRVGVGRRLDHRVDEEPDVGGLILHVSGIRPTRVVGARQREPRRHDDEAGRHPALQHRLGELGRATQPVGEDDQRERTRTAGRLEVGHRAGRRVAARRVEHERLEHPLIGAGLITAGRGRTGRVGERLRPHAHPELGCGRSRGGRRRPGSGRGNALGHRRRDRCGLPTLVVVGAGPEEKHTHRQRAKGPQPGSHGRTPYRGVASPVRRRTPRPRTRHRPVLHRPGSARRRSPRRAASPVDPAARRS